MYVASKNLGTGDIGDNAKAIRRDTNSMVFETFKAILASGCSFSSSSIILLVRVPFPISGLMGFRGNLASLSDGHVVS